MGRIAPCVRVAMSDLFSTGIRPIVDQFLIDEALKVRDYGDYWSASSAGYCQRKLIFERLGVPPVATPDPRKQRVFTAGHIFHDWLQELTRKAGVSIAQEVELQDEDLMVRGHFDDLILVPPTDKPLDKTDYYPTPGKWTLPDPQQHLILYDYKTVNSRSFMWAKKNGNAMSYYHRMQLGTYTYMLRKTNLTEQYWPTNSKMPELIEARILKIEKENLMMMEQQLLWSPELEKEVLAYWILLNQAWEQKLMPRCTCADHEGGFMAQEKFNPFFYAGEPCSLEWYKLVKKEGKLRDYTEA